MGLKPLFLQDICHVDLFTIYYILDTNEQLFQLLYILFVFQDIWKCR